MLQRTLLLLLLFASSLFAQAKVGTSGAQFLEISQSVRANGMGENGVALIDRQSFFYNPGTLGLTGNQLTPASVNFGVGDLPADVENYSTGIVMRLKGDADHRSLFLAIQRIWLESGTMIERTYQQGTFEGTGREFRASAQVYSVTMASGFGSKIKVGLGATAKWIEERFHDYSTTGFSFDAGGLVRIPLNGGSDTLSDLEAKPTLHLTFGASLTNYGMDMKFIDKAYPLPKTVRVGAAFEATRDEFTAVAIIAKQSLLGSGESNEQIGLEIGYRSALWARVGFVDGDIDQFSRTTFGGSVSVRGVARMLSGSTSEKSNSGGFLRQMDLIGSWAGNLEGENSLFEGTDYYMLEFVI